MKPIKVAQIGTMHDHADQTLRSLTDLKEYFDVVGIAEPEEIGKERLGNKFFKDVPHYTVEELLKMDDLEAVTIETQEESATYYAQLFAEKGIHVHLDKPGSQNRESFEKLVATLRSHNAVFQQGYMYRYNPIVIDALKRVKNGELGEIFSVEAQMSVHHPKQKREWLGKHRGGMLYFLGCHLIDLVLQLQGEPLEIINLNTCTGMDGLTEPIDYGCVVFKYKNGSSFIKSSAAEIGGVNRRQLVIQGTLGTIEIKPLEIFPDESTDIQTQYREAMLQDEVMPFRDKQEIKTTERFDRYDTMMTEFARYIRGEKENPYTYDHELKVFDLLMRCCGL